MAEPRRAAGTNGLLIAAGIMAAALWASGALAANTSATRSAGPLESIDLPAAVGEPADRLATPGAGASGSPTIGGCTVFPADNPWNTDISDLPVHPRSAHMIATIQSNGGDELHPDFGSDPAYGIPYVVVPADQPLLPITYGAYGDESDPGPFPIPLDAPVEGGSDAHVLVVQQGTCQLFELFAASRTGGGWRADSGARWDLSTGALRPIGWTSADAAGLPILPGLVRYDEVASGVIRHAIRVTFSRTQRGFILPATHFASSDANPNLPAMGQRLRLRADVDITGLTGAARVIAIAMRDYGLIVADNGSNWYVQGARDPRWDDEDLRQLKSLPGTAFEVVDTGPVRTS